MRPKTHELWHPLMGPRGVEDDLPGTLVGGTVIKIIKKERGALDTDQIRNIEAGRREFRS